MSRLYLSKKRILRVLVFTFVVFVVVVFVSPTAFRPSVKKGIEEATGIVCGKILLTRQKALAGKTRYRIHYDYATGACTTYRQVSPGRWVPEAPDIGRIPRDVSISSTSTPSDGYIEIDANGAIENHGVPVVIRLVDGEGTHKSIRISPAGMVQELPTW